MRIKEDEAKKIVRTVVGNLENKKDFLEAEINIDGKDYIVAKNAGGKLIPNENLLYRDIKFSGAYYNIYIKNQKV